MFLAKVTLQYFDGCPHWKLADERLARVLHGVPRGKVTREYQRIDSPETAERIGFHGSPTILVDGRDPFAGGAEPVGMTCQVYRTEQGAQGAPPRLSFPVTVRLRCRLFVAHRALLSVLVDTTQAVVASIVCVLAAAWLVFT